MEDARVYSTHANRKTINIDDVKLAVSQKLDHAFTSPPPREVSWNMDRLYVRSQNLITNPTVGHKEQKLGQIFSCLLTRNVVQASKESICFL